MLRLAAALILALIALWAVIVVSLADWLPPLWWPLSAAHLCIN